MFYGLYLDHRTMIGFWLVTELVTGPPPRKTTSYVMAYTRTPVHIFKYSFNNANKRDAMFVRVIKCGFETET